MKIQQLGIKQIFFQIGFLVYFLLLVLLCYLFPMTFVGIGKLISIYQYIVEGVSCFSWLVVEDRTAVLRPQ